MIVVSLTVMKENMKLKWCYKMEGEVKVEQPNSCEIGINAKGQWSGKVKVYSETIEEAMKLAIIKANELSGLIKEKNTKVV